MKLFITELDTIARAAIHKIADSHGFDHEAFDIACTVRLSPDILFHVERWQCNRPRILCNAEQLLAVTGKRSRLHRWESGALKAIIGAVRMLRTNALLSPQQAMEIRAERLEARRTTARFKPLPSRYFTSTATVTVTERLTGLSLTDAMKPGESYSECESRLQQALSLLLLQNDETAELVDTLEQVRSFQPDPAPDTVTVSVDTTLYTFGD